eukprot:6745575-Prymnesium_polylepis.1
MLRGMHVVCMYNIGYVLAGTAGVAKEVPVVAVVWAALKVGRAAKAAGKAGIEEEAVVRVGLAG